VSFSYRSKDTTLQCRDKQGWAGRDARRTADPGRTWLEDDKSADDQGLLASARMGRHALQPDVVGSTIATRVAGEECGEVVGFFLLTPYSNVNLYYANLAASQYAEDSPNSPVPHVHWACPTSSTQITAFGK